MLSHRLKFSDHSLLGHVVGVLGIVALFWSWLGPLPQSAFPRGLDADKRPCFCRSADGGHAGSSVGPGPCDPHVRRDARRQQRHDARARVRLLPLHPGTRLLPRRAHAQVQGQYSLPVQKGQGQYSPQCRKVRVRGLRKKVQGHQSQDLLLLKFQVIRLYSKFKVGGLVCPAKVMVTGLISRRSDKRSIGQNWHSTQREVVVRSLCCVFCLSYRTEFHELCCFSQTRAVDRRKRVLLFPPHALTCFPRVHTLLWEGTRTDCPTCFLIVATCLHHVFAGVPEQCYPG